MMIGLEATAVSWRPWDHKPSIVYDYPIWCLHLALLGISILMFGCVSPNLVITSTAGRRCCGMGTITIIQPQVIENQNELMMYQNQAHFQGGQTSSQGGIAGVPRIGTNAFIAQLPGAVMQQGHNPPFDIQQPLVREQSVFVPKFMPGIGVNATATMHNHQIPMTGMTAPAVINNLSPDAANGLPTSLRNETPTPAASIASTE